MARVNRNDWGIGNTLGGGSDFLLFILKKRDLEAK